MGSGGVLLGGALGVGVAGVEVLGVVAGGGVGVGSAVGVDEQPTAAERTRATKPSHGSFIAP
jgi:hypothetical protein